MGEEANEPQSGERVCRHSVADAASKPYHGFQPWLPSVAATRLRNQSVSSRRKVVIFRTNQDSRRIHRSIASNARLSESSSFRRRFKEWSPPSTHTNVAFAPIFATTFSNTLRSANVPFVPLIKSIGIFSAYRC